MKITNIALQAKNNDRVNVSVDGAYRFSLTVAQVSDLGLKIGREVDEEELERFEQESQFGKLYMRALEYCLMRPHSAKEVRDYLWRKTRPTRNKEGVLRPGYAPQITERVFDRLAEKGYIDDAKFARFWVENRHRVKGTSQRKLTNELRAKGVDSTLIDEALHASDRDESEELRRVLQKKRIKYPDEQKLIAYLVRQGFSYDDIRSAMSEN